MCMHISMRSSFLVHCYDLLLLGHRHTHTHTIYTPKANHVNLEASQDSPAALDPQQRVVSAMIKDHLLQEKVCF